LPEKRPEWHSDGLLAARGVAEEIVTVWWSTHLGSPFQSISYPLHLILNIALADEKGLRS